MTCDCLQLVLVNASPLLVFTAGTKCLFSTETLMCKENMATEIKLCPEFRSNSKRHPLSLVGYLGCCILCPQRLCSSWTRTSVSSREILFDTASLDFPCSSTVTAPRPTPRSWFVYLLYMMLLFICSLQVMITTDLVLFKLKHSGVSV